MCFCDKLTSLCMPQPFFNKYKLTANVTCLGQKLTSQNILSKMSNISNKV